MVQAWFLRNRRSATRLCVLLVLALVFAEAGAVQHQYAHGASTQVCSDCLGFAPLLAPAGGKAHLLSIVRAQAGTPYRQLTAPLAAQTPQNAFRSRAPPHFA